MTEQFPVILNLFQDLITQKGRQLKPMNVKKSGGQASLEGKKIRRYEGKLFSVNSLSSNPPTLLPSTNHSGGNASLIPPYELPFSRKGRGKFASPFTKKLAAFTLAEGATHVDTTDNVRRAAFTLAEVLITIGIIGVVAAMTIPALIANYQKKQTVTQLKKAYTVLSQAVQRSILDNGEIESWDWQSIYYADEFGKRYILPYLNGVNRLKNQSAQGYSWTFLDGTSARNTPVYSLLDGMFFRFDSLDFVNDPDHTNYVKTHIKVSIDINGAKIPNQYGRDVFVFSIFPFDERSKGKLVPGSNDQCGGGGIHNNFSRDGLVTSGCATCKSDHTGYGFGCAAVIMKDGWVIKDDYPW